MVIMTDFIGQRQEIIVHTRTDGKSICLDCSWNKGGSRYKCILGLYNRTSCNRYKYLKEAKDE